MYEIVRIVEPLFLVNSRRRACRYRTADARPLAPGYYLALWPTPQGDARDYGNQVAYVGPLQRRDQAELLQDSALALGLIAPARAKGRPVRAPRLLASIHAAYMSLLQAEQCNAA